MTTDPLKPADRWFGLYLAAFVAAWVLYVLLVYRHVQALGEASFTYAAANIGVRLAVWVAPVFLMLRLVDRAQPFRGLGMVEHWKRGVLVGLALSVLLFAVAVIRFGWPHDPSRHLTWNSLASTSIGVGFFEEIPFRGYILRKLETRMNFGLANGLSTLVFLSLHLPGWFMLHLFTPALALNLIVLSLIWGAVFRYSGSLWSAVISHSANDFISGVLFA